MSVGARMHPCFTPLVMGNGAETTIFDNPGHHAVVKLSHNADEFCWASKFEHDLPKSVSANCVECFCEIDISGIKVHVLFLTFFLQLPCGEDHVCGPSVFPEATLALWEETVFKVKVEAIE